jgi:hypothetical protein
MIASLDWSRSERERMQRERGCKERERERNRLLFVSKCCGACHGARCASNDENKQTMRSRMQSAGNFDLLDCSRLKRERENAKRERT